MADIPKWELDIIQDELARYKLCNTCWKINQQAVTAKHIIAMGVLETMEVRIYGYCTSHGYVIKKAYADGNLKFDLDDSDYVDEILIHETNETPGLQI